ncbi:hypothetical protein [Pseudomonas lijiangensis]|uniref:Uncharacterized protein n=1 Tax=Pseudomonas lijiangensis TaxID=2995658 RepID=A0ABX8HUV5_9PSED|nr:MULTISPECIES: hypothetical protein [Pseudomonas syringae group]MBX8499089.1 hypothetical protein [Pseudomonas lijiangensis]MBX8504041.1 hypothetical protein [Pseudomonas lijiangensis]MBX8540823.1 hypothetical protein [Pseudomonas cichorii]MBX8563303.1 hypothetical protein [Pseudomonas cichorii]MBX8581908.1 hypothetical protein [Pseudomonas cichorii]
MDSKQSIELGAKVIEVQTLMIAYATDGRTSAQPAEYRELYADILLDLKWIQRHVPSSRNWSKAHEACLSGIRLCHGGCASETLGSAGVCE